MISADKQQLLAQERVIKKIRQFFDTKGFHEIIAPVLNPAVPIEEHLTSFTTVWKTKDGEQTMFLPASPERALKLALAARIGNCYSIGHSFRNLEQTSIYHAPEFLMLEWYREDATDQDIMNDVEKLFSFVCHSRGGSDSAPASGIQDHNTHSGSPISTASRRFEDDKDWPRISLVDLFRQYAHFDLLHDDLEKHMTAEGYRTEGASWHELFDQLFLNEIEPNLPKEPTFLTDFPVRISPLCKPKPEAPYLAQRFEVYLNGIELGNGNTEETDSGTVRAEFTRLAKSKQMPIDEDFLTALDAMHGKSFAGIGIGIERLLALTGSVR